MYGKVESLNASVAGALIMYEVVRARELKKKKIVNPYLTVNEPLLMSSSTFTQPSEPLAPQPETNQDVEQTEDRKEKSKKKTTKSKK